MLYGVALGDALGAPHERGKQKPYTGTFTYPIILNSQYQGRRVSALGQVTDDTEMTLVAAHSLLKDDRSSTVLDYMKWANSKIPFLGKNTRALFSGIKTEKSYLKRWHERFEPSKTADWTQSNGSLMRCSPLFVLSDDQIVADCMLTNPHPVNMEANVIYCRALRRLFNGDDATTIFKDSVTNAVEPVLRERLVQIRDGVEIDYTENKGWVVHAFGLAMGALLSSEPYHVQIGRIIQLHGSDTDTNAAIAGAMIGARYGYVQMMKHKTTRENARVVAECDTSVGSFPRPVEYTMGCVDELVKQIYAKYP